MTTPMRYLAIFAVFAAFVLYQAHRRDRLRTTARTGASVPSVAALKWDTVALPAGTTLPIRIVSKARCEFGDLDAIDTDLYYDPESPLIVSLESLGSPEIGVSAPVDRKVLAGRVEIDLPLAQGETHSPYALSLCRDKQRSGRCLPKEALSPTALVVRDTTDAGTKNFLPPDRNYWISPLVVSYGRKLLVPVLEPAPASAEGWSSALRARPELGQSQSDRITFVAGRLETLRPPGARAEGERLEITLYHRDAKLCAR